MHMYHINLEFYHKKVFLAEGVFKPILLAADIGTDASPRCLSRGMVQPYTLELLELDHTYNSSESSTSNQGTR